MACPKCACLLCGSEELACPSCGPVGRYIDGIPCFADPDYYWGEIPLDEMRKANCLAAEVGWEAAVERVLTRPSLRQYVSDPRRADFQYIWNLPPDSSVLDIGAGWGAIATALGRNFSRVVAVEGVFERTRFIDIRVRQMKLPVEVICADFLNLPLVPEQFDVVVLNGVLEWAAMGAQGDPREIQLGFLRSVRRLLKPSGFVCLGIENRIGWDALRGGTDHSGLSYTSLLPRRLAALVCNLKHQEYRSDQNRGYRTYTYSLPGYRKLFRQAGFGAVSAFHAWHGYNKPTVLLPLDHKEALLHFVDSQQLSGSGLRGNIKELGLRAAARTGILAHCASDFIFLMEKG